jgi:putative ABC transport system permease protein
MLKVTWRNLVARRLRLLLSAFAIVLGVAFVSGSLVFTDAMGGTFDDIIEGSTADAEVAFEGANDFNSLQDSRLMPASVVDRLEELPEVGSAHPGLLLQTVFVVGADGKVVGGNGPPGLAFNPTDATSITGRPVLTLAEGELPDGPAEVALERKTADRAGMDVGDEVRLVTPGAPPQMTADVTGIVDFGGGGVAGATITIFDAQYMQDRFFGGRDGYMTVSLNAADGVSQTQLADAVRPVLPPGVQVSTGDDLAEAQQEELDEVLGFIQTFLLVFAGVALVVGIFMIINTFSILVAQRTRELALLRAMGASRRQVMGSVVLEAAAVGVIGSTVGLGVGYLLALALKALFGSFGLDLGTAQFTVSPSTAAAAYLVGVLVTVVAAVLPARRASRVAPVAALRDDVALPEATLRRRVLVGVLLAALGVACVVAGFSNEGTLALSLLGAGMLLVLVGVTLVSALVGRPLIHAFGLLYRRLFGTVGVLATENSLRNPRRMSATASALMVGLTLVTLVAVLGASASASTDTAVNKSVTSQFIVSNVVGQPFSTDVAEQVAKVDGVAGVAAVRTAFPEVDGEATFVAAVDPKALGLALAVPMESGSLARLGPGTAAVNTQTAEQLGLNVGDPVTMQFQGGDVPLTVIGTFDNSPAVPGAWLVTFDTLAKGGLTPLDSTVFVTKEPGADTDAVRDGIEEVTADLPTVTVKDPEGYADEQKEQINQFLYFIYGLLGLSVVIATLGVVNTLSLSVIERTREIGLLRAVGLARRQLRTMIRLEAVVVGVFGALLGVALGLGFGVALVRALRSDGLTDLAIPVTGLTLFVLAAGALGVLAAVFPARRAARLDVLRAIYTE